MSKPPAPARPAGQIGDAQEAAVSAVPRRISSSELLGPATGLVIVHNGREYLLRVTQNGKLILTA